MNLLPRENSTRGDSMWWTASLDTLTFAFGRHTFDGMTITWGDPNHLQIYNAARQNHAETTYIHALDTCSLLIPYYHHPTWLAPHIYHRKWPRTRMTSNGRTFPVTSGNTVQGHHLLAHTKVLRVHEGPRGSALRFRPPLRASTCPAIIAAPAAHDANAGS